MFPEFCFLFNLVVFFALVNCGKPDVDFNGMVYGSDWWVGSVVRYDCRPGFVLVGDPARACQSNGKWTPKPSCLSKTWPAWTLHTIYRNIQKVHTVILSKKKSKVVIGKLSSY